MSGKRPIKRWYSTFRNRVKNDTKNYYLAKQDLKLQCKWKAFDTLQVKKRRFNCNLLFFIENGNYSWFGIIMKCKKLDNIVEEGKEWYNEIVLITSKDEMGA